MGWIIATVVVVALLLCAATPLIRTAVRNGVRGRRLLTVAWKAVTPGFMVDALVNLLRYSEEAADITDRHDLDRHHKELAAAFDRDTATEQHTLGGGFRGVGLMPWLVALLAANFASALASASGGSQNAPVVAALVFLMVFPTLYRAGDSALDTLGIGRGMQFFGSIVWVVFAGFLQTVIGTVTKVLLGTVWAPVHLFVFAFKGARLARRMSDLRPREDCITSVRPRSP